MYSNCPASPRSGPTAAADSNTPNVWPVTGTGLLGSLNEIWATNDLKAATRQFAERLAQNPPAAIGGTKSLVYQAALTPAREQLDAEEHHIIEAMQTPEFRAAVKKFTSKGK